jgi:hypothetical protein
VVVTLALSYVSRRISIADVLPSEGKIVTELNVSVRYLSVGTTAVVVAVEGGRVRGGTNAMIRYAAESDADGCGAQSDSCPSVDFHVLSAEEIRKGSVVEVSEVAVWSRSLPAVGGVNDHRMGRPHSAQPD